MPRLNDFLGYQIWMVHPHIRPPNIVGEDATTAARQPRVEYLATLSRHSAAVNVVRFSPNGRPLSLFFHVDAQNYISR